MPIFVKEDWMQLVQCEIKIWDIHPLIPIINAAGGISQIGKIKVHQWRKYCDI